MISVGLLVPRTSREEAWACFAGAQFVLHVGLRQRDFAVGEAGAFNSPACGRSFGKAGTAAGAGASCAHMVAVSRTAIAMLRMAFIIAPPASWFRRDSIRAPAIPPPDRARSRCGCWQPGISSQTASPARV